MATSHADGQIHGFHQTFAGPRMDIVNYQADVGVGVVIFLGPKIGLNEQTKPWILAHLHFFSSDFSIF